MDDTRNQDEVSIGTLDASNRCPYGHIGSVFLRYRRELVCARCGVRIVDVPGREID